MSHTVSDVEETPFGFAVVCECDKRFLHRLRASAEYQHEVHVEIETARARLRGEGTS